MARPAMYVQTLLLVVHFTTGIKDRLCGNFKQ